MEFEKELKKLKRAKRIIWFLVIILLLIGAFFAYISLLKPAYTNFVREQKQEVIYDLADLAIRDNFVSIQGREGEIIVLARVPKEYLK